VTVDTYGHLVPGGNKAAVDRLDDAPDVTIRNPAATATRRVASHDLDPPSSHDHDPGVPKPARS